MRQHNPPHPGELIREVYLKSLGDRFSRSDIAKRLDVSRSTFNRLVNEEIGVSPEMAVRLFKVLGGTAESWMRMQANYDLSLAMKSVNIKNLVPLDTGAEETRVDH